MGFLAGQPQRLQFIDIFKTGLYKCVMSTKNKKKGKKNYKQKRCFACITLDNKVILKVRLTFHLWWFWVGSESLRIYFIFTYGALCTDTQLKLVPPPYYWVFSQLCFDSGDDEVAALPVGTISAPGFLFVPLVAFGMALWRSDLSRRTIVWHSIRNLSNLLEWISSCIFLEVFLRWWKLQK